jgi:hypothetical protein
VNPPGRHLSTGDRSVRARISGRPAHEIWLFVQDDYRVVLSDDLVAFAGASFNRFRSATVTQRPSTRRIPASSSVDTMTLTSGRLVPIVSHGMLGAPTVAEIQDAPSRPTVAASIVSPFDITVMRHRTVFSGKNTWFDRLIRSVDNLFLPQVYTCEVFRQALER